MPFITQGKANLKYILIVVILAAIVGGGILGYQYWWVPKHEVTVPEVKIPEAKAPEEEIIETAEIETLDMSTTTALLKEWRINIIQDAISIIDDSEVSPAIPFIKDSRIFIFNLTNDSLKETDQGVDSSYGNQMLATSPNFKKFTFQDSGGNFRIATADLNHDINAVDISDHSLTYRPSIRAIGWSKNGNKLLFRISSGSPERGTSPETPLQMEKDFSKTPFGNYLIDFEKREIKKIGIPDNIYFLFPIDDNHIFVLKETNREGTELLGIFDLQKLNIVYIKKLDGIYGKYSIDNLSNKWSFLFGPFGYEYSAIVYAEFPKLKGQIIEKGGWADIQAPLISPDGNKIVFVRTPGGFLATSLWIYNYNDKSKRKLSDLGGNQEPVIWIDNERFISYRFPPLKEYYLYNLHDGSVTLIFKQ